MELSRPSSLEILTKIKLHLQILLGKPVNCIDTHDQKDKEKLIHYLKLYVNATTNRHNKTKELTSEEASSYVDVGCQTSSFDQYSSTFCYNENLPSSSTFGFPVTFTDREVKLLSQPDSISQHSTNETETSRAVRIRNPDHGKICVTSYAAVDGAINFLKLTVELKSQGAPHRLLLSPSESPLRMLTSVFHVVRGIEEVIRCVVVLKRTKGDHNGDHHNYVVDLLSRVCAIDRQVRDCVIEKIELLMKSASSDEEDIWCLSLLIQYLCEKNRDMCFKLVKMLVRLFSLEIESHVKKSEHWEVQSVYSFCILNTIKTVVRFLKNQLENTTEKDNYSTLDRFMTLKSDLAKSFTQLEANQNQQESPSLNFSNHNLCLISYIFQDILKHTQDCISLIEERALS